MNRTCLVTAMPRKKPSMTDTWFAASTHGPGLRDVLATGDPHAVDEHEQRPQDPLDERVHRAIRGPLRGRPPRSGRARHRQRPATPGRAAGPPFGPRASGRPSRGARLARGCTTHRSPARRRARTRGASFWRSRPGRRAAAPSRVPWTMASRLPSSGERSSCSGSHGASPSTRRHRLFGSEPHRHRAAHREAEHERPARREGRDRGASVLHAEVEAAPRLDPVAHLAEAETRGSERRAAPRATRRSSSTCRAPRRARRRSRRRPRQAPIPSRVAPRLSPRP